MPDSGAVHNGRPLCRCHGEPMDTWTRANGTRASTCSVRRRARQAAAYRAAPAAENYARARRLLKARIRRKRQQIEKLESFLEEENTR